MGFRVNGSSDRAVDDGSVAIISGFLQVSRLKRSRSSNRTFVEMKEIELILIILIVG